MRLDFTAKESLVDSIGRVLEENSFKRMEAAARVFPSIAKRIASEGGIEGQGRREESRRNITKGKRHYMDSFRAKARRGYLGAIIDTSNSSPVAGIIEYGNPPHVIMPTGGRIYLQWPAGNVRDVPPYIRSFGVNWRATNNARTQTGHHTVELATNEAVETAFGTSSATRGSSL